MDIIFRFKQRGMTIATDRYSSEVMPIIPRVGECVDNINTSEFPYKGVVEKIVHCAKREPKEIWITINCDKNIDQ